MKKTNVLILSSLFVGITLAQNVKADVPPPTPVPPGVVPVRPNPAPPVKTAQDCKNDVLKAQAICKLIPIDPKVPPPDKQSKCMEAAWQQYLLCMRSVNPGVTPPPIMGGPVMSPIDPIPSDPGDDPDLQ